MYLPWYWMKMMDDVGFDKDDDIFEQPCCEDKYTWLYFAEPRAQGLLQ